MITILVSSCSKSNNSSSNNTSTACTVTGTTVNIGTAKGNGYSFFVGNSGDCIGFDNTTLNFSICLPVAPGPYGLVDVGPQACLNFSDTVITADACAYIQGDGYEGLCADGHIIKFIAGGYNNGIVTVTYVYK